MRRSFSLTCFWCAGCRNSDSVSKRSRCSCRPSSSAAVASRLSLTGPSAGGPARRRHAQLVADDLDGHRQVQGAELRIRRNVDELLAPREIVVREARLLGAHEHGDAILGQALPDRRGRFARIDDRNDDGPQARARADDPAAIGDGALQVVVNPRRPKKVVCTRRARRRLVARKMPRPHERELAEPHRLHRTRRGADVAGVRGVDQHDANGNVHGGECARRAALPRVCLRTGAYSTLRAQCTAWSTSQFARRAAPERSWFAT